VHLNNYTKLNHYTCRRSENSCVCARGARTHTHTYTHTHSHSHTHAHTTVDVGRGGPELSACFQSSDSSDLFCSFSGPRIFLIFSTVLFFPRTHAQHGEDATRHNLFLF